MNKKEHKSKYELSCPECKKKLDSKESLLLHIGFVHDLFWCDICKETFRNHHLLRKHKKLFHNSNKASKKYVAKKKIKDKEKTDLSKDYESIVEDILNSIFDFGPRQLIEQILPYFKIKEGKNFKIYYRSSKNLIVEKIQDLLETAFIVESNINLSKSSYTLSIDIGHLVFLSQQVTLPPLLERKIIKEIHNPKRKDKNFMFSKKLVN